jgi:hypothetical protein
MIQRSLDLGIQMQLVRQCETRAVSLCILGGIKEVVSVLSRTRPPDTESLVQEILDFGLRGVARPELLEAIDQTSRNSRTARVKNETESGQPFFIAHN